MPTGLAGSLGEAAVVLSWIAPEDDGGSAVTDYVVRYSLDEGLTWTTVVEGSGTSTTATVSGLAVGVVHRFSVAASNEAGTGTTATVDLTPVDTSSPTISSASAAPTEIWEQADACSGRYQTSLLTVVASDGSGIASVTGAWSTSINFYESGSVDLVEADGSWSGTFGPFPDHSVATALSEDVEVTLTVTDGAGNTSTAEVTVTVTSGWFC